MKKVLILIILIVLAFKTNSQSYFSEYGECFTPRKELKILIVFISFKDQVNGQDSDWPLNQPMPNWANDNYFFDDINDFNNIDSNNKSISRYYFEMTKSLQSTNQQFKLTAKFLPIVLDNYSDATNWWSLDYKVMEKLRNTPNIQSILQSVDNRGSANFLRSNADDVLGDGYVDYCVFNYRYSSSWTSNDVPIPGMNNWYGSGGGLSGISGGSIGNYVISSGHNAVDGLKPNLKVFTHELGHNLYNPPHYGGCNNVLKPFLNTTSFGGMMPDIKNEVYGGANAWESWYLGWINIKHDLSDLNDNGDFVIGDYLTTGDAIRIKLPFVENQNIWLEYHKGENAFDKRTKWVDELCGYPLPPSPSGLLIYIESITSDKSEIYSFNKGSGIKMIHKQGNYDFKINNLVVSSQLCGNITPNFIINEENAFSGISKASRFLWDKNEDGNIDYSGNNNIGPRELSEIWLLNDEYIYGNFATDAGFQIGDSVGINTNPAIINLQPFNQSNQLLSPIYLNGISIKVLSQDSLGNMTVRIRFNDYNFNNDIRMCGDIVFPSDTININANINIDKSGTTNRITKYNGEFINPSIITTAKNSYLRVKENKNIIIQKESVFVLDSNATIELNDNSRIIVDSSATLIIKPNTNLILKGNSKIEIKKGAFLCVEEGVNINLLDANSIIEVNSQALLEKNSYAIYRNLLCSCISDLNDISINGCGAIINFTETETTANEIWNSTKKIANDFTIKTGHTLTIQNAKISIAPDIKIKIEPGAKLIIDNSTLTNYCGSNYWGGIEVFGIKKQLQAEQYQGTLIVKNNSIIENSRNAISTWRTNDWNSTGGIVKAENSTFRNNIRSAEFLSYKNTNSNTGEKSNVSRFTNCIFTWDRSMFPHDKTSLSHVTLWDVMGVMFIGCDFTDNQILNNSIIKHGILAEDAGFKVLAKISITPQGYNVDKSSFTKLSYGIRVSNTEKSVEVMDSYFGDNFCGVFATSANNLTITTNELKLKPVLNIRELYPTEPAYGVVLDKSKIYKLEQNNFFGEDKNLKATGLQVKNLGGSPINIKNNTFRDILYSTIAIGKNRGTNNIGESVGVKYNCNDFIATNYGISVIRDKNANNESWYGIDLYQNGGNVTQPAENIFDNKEYPLYSDIYIEDDINTYTYSYNADESTKNPLSISPNILKNPASNETDCSRDYGLLDDLELHNHHTFIENEYLTLLYNYNNLLDGGSKDELLDKLLDSWEGDVWDLRQAYLDASPYLSSDVLKELALSEKLPLAVYLEVALSNPEGTQKDEYIEFMNTEEGESFLTPTGIELIKGSWDTKTFRATLESNISSKLSDMEAVSRTIIYRILNDSTGVNISNYRDRLNSIRNIEAKYELVDSYIGTKEYNTAETLLNTLLADPNNEKYNADDINDYLLLLSIMRDKNDTTNLIPIDERLETLSNSSTRAGAKAKAYLYFNNQDTDYHPDYVDLDLKEKSKTTRRAKPSLTQLFGADVTISPNPAKDHIILTYDLPSKQVYTIKIYDNKGIEILTKTLNSNKGVQTIELKNLKSGAYYYTITDSKGVIKSDKLIIVK